MRWYERFAFVSFILFCAAIVLFRLRVPCMKHVAISLMYAVAAVSFMLAGAAANERDLFQTILALIAGTLFGTALAARTFAVERELEGS